MHKCEWFKRWVHPSPEYWLILWYGMNLSFQLLKISNFIWREANKTTSEIDEGHSFVLLYLVCYPCGHICIIVVLLITHGCRADYFTFSVMVMHFSDGMSLLVLLAQTHWDLSSMVKLLSQMYMWSSIDCQSL